MKKSNLDAIGGQQGLGRLGFTHMYTRYYLVTYRYLGTSDYACMSSKLLVAHVSHADLNLASRPLDEMADSNSVIARFTGTAVAKFS